MTAFRLRVLYGTAEVGALARAEDDRLAFSYTESWRRSAGAWPISHSLPLGGGPWTGGPAQAFFANLLPEGAIRTLTCRRLGLAPDDDFALLAAIGGDCAGALRLVQEGAEVAEAAPGMRELSARELSALARQGSVLPLLTGQDGLRLSLAGAQDKLPVVFRDGRIHLPLGATPSTHVLKLPSRDFAHLPVVEAFTTALAAACGLEVVRADLLPGPGGEPMLLIERYDRARTADGASVRLHQEDLCQALGVGPLRKYEQDGGPGFAVCHALVAAHCLEPALATRGLVDWLLLNVLLGNADGHAKNISLLRSPGGLRLAPFYDLVCTRAYPGLSPALAMRIGGESDPARLGRRAWEALAREAGLTWRYLRERLGELGERLETALRPTAEAMRTRHGDSPAIPRVQAAVRKFLRAALRAPAS